MKLFSGFPQGKLEVTPLPNLFFSELLPAIDDAAELKITLHIFWLLAHSKPQFVRAHDLRADRTLMKSLKAVDAKPENALAQGLVLATERGTLLHLPTQDANDALYFLNTEQGRRAFEEMQGEAQPRTAPREPASVAERPNIFVVYENNIGLLTPIIAEELLEAEKQYPLEWIEEAFKIAVENNKRSWSYARKILERWKTEGRAGKGKKSKSWYEEYGKFVKR